MKGKPAPLETDMANFHHCEWADRALKAEQQLEQMNTEILDWKVECVKWRDRATVRKSQLEQMKEVAEYFDECSQSGFVTVTNPYTFCANKLQAILEVKS